jgi:hypothetical protein
MDTSTIERRSAATHIALGRTQKLEPRGSAARWPVQPIGAWPARRMGACAGGRAFSLLSCAVQNDLPSKNVANSIIKGDGL